MTFTLLIARVNSQTRSYLTCYHLSLPSFLKDFIYLASDHHCLLLFLPGWCFLIFSTFKCCNYAELSHQTSHFFHPPDGFKYHLYVDNSRIYISILDSSLELQSFLIQLATQTLHSSV